MGPTIIKVVWRHQPESGSCRRTTFTLGFGGYWIKNGTAVRGQIKIAFILTSGPPVRATGLLWAVTILFEIIIPEGESPHHKRCTMHVCALRSILRMYV